MCVNRLGPFRPAQRHRNSACPIPGRNHPENRTRTLIFPPRCNQIAFFRELLELTIDDARMYTRPFTVKVTEVLLPDSDVLEFVCTDNEKGRAHLPDQ